MPEATATFGMRSSACEQCYSPRRVLPFWKRVSDKAGYSTQKLDSYALHLAYLAESRLRCVDRPLTDWRGSHFGDSTTVGRLHELCV